MDTELKWLRRWEKPIRQSQTKIDRTKDKQDPAGTVANMPRIDYETLMQEIRK